MANAIAVVSMVFYVFVDVPDFAQVGRWHVHCSLFKLLWYQLQIGVIPNSYFADFQTTTVVSDCDSLEKVRRASAGAQQIKDCCKSM